jgi:hypothetical protein
MTPAEINFVKDVRRIAPDAQVTTYTYPASLNKVILVEWLIGKRHVRVEEVVTPQTVMLWGYECEKSLYSRIISKVKETVYREMQIVTDED